MSLILIGYWDDRAEIYPSAHALVAHEWDEVERDLVVDHLRRGFVARAFMGYANCRICKAQVGNLEFSDGIYVWPEGLSHYVSEHGVRLPGSFVDHVIEFTESLEDQATDDVWWKSAADVRSTVWLDQPRANS